jgi:hypothetical protein
MGAWTEGKGTKKKVEHGFPEFPQLRLKSKSALSALHQSVHKLVIQTLARAASMPWPQWAMNGLACRAPRPQRATFSLAGCSAAADTLILHIPASNTVEILTWELSIKITAPSWPTLASLSSHKTLTNPPPSTLRNERAQETTDSVQPLQPAPRAAQ